MSEPLKTELKVVVSPDWHQGATLERAVDADIDAFEKYFCGELKNDSLSKPEKAILKTYLFFKAVVEPRRELEKDPTRP